MNLSFNTDSLSFYRAQVSSDLRQWTDNPWGILGDGTLKTMTITNVAAGARGFYRLLVETPTQLRLPQSTAFAILGHSCGGIQETVSAGFDVTSGYPSGVVSLSTRCGGSGRGGGYHTTTHTATAVVVWDFAGNVISATPMIDAVNPTGGSDAFGDLIYNANHEAHLIVPIPPAPGGVSAVQINDQFQVSWTPNAVNPLAILSSVLTATPVHSPASILTTTVIGSATTGTVSSLQPQTTYEVTVVNTTLGGSSRASTPIRVTTSAATIAPSAPTDVAATWANQDPSGTTDTLVATWQAPDAGNSPIDQYLVIITGSDGAGAFTQTVSVTTLTASFSLDYVPNWSVKVQAHNAAGWGPVSSAFHLGGL
ncbi:MAG: fibronectin type III domain-containing protein [Verrucomicrobia bacterium]|nr:fibronectin type III domain-containing protein [Verrucomicrobiota bacterium]